MVTAQSAIRRLIKLQPQKARTCNELAWTLATGPEALRDPPNAVVFSRRASEDKSISEINRALYMNTLGVALYRAGNIPEATAVLEESLAMQLPISQPFDLFFLAMCSARAGDPKTARDYFDKAIALVQQFKSKLSAEWVKELELFEQEARVLLIGSNPETDAEPVQPYQ